MVGNKGGIGIALRIRNRNFMFINSHLKSGQNEQITRNKEFTNIKNNFMPSYILGSSTIPL